MYHVKFWASHCKHGAWLIQYEENCLYLIISDNGHDAKYRNNCKGKDKDDNEHSDGNNDNIH